MIFLNGCTQKNLPKVEVQPYKAKFKENDFKVVEAPKMQYPYIDGASPECRYLTEKQMEQKRINPEKNFTCDK
jgi:hypothetical protein